MIVNFKVDKNCQPPVKAYEDDAGFDIFSPVDIDIPANSSVLIDTGVHFEIPKGFVGFLKSKSGLLTKHNLTSEGVIDSGYTGSICVKLFNHSNEVYHISWGDKISQIVFLTIPFIQLNQVEELQETERGNNGFGSTGK